METCSIAAFSTATLPPVSWFLAMRGLPEIQIEACENYQRQTYRNRYRIIGPNGMQTLSIPVKNHHGEKIPIRDVRIDYREAWQRSHWRSLTTAYNNSPFFLYLGDEFYPFFNKKYEFLFDFNLELLQKIMKIMKMKTVIILTDTFIPISAKENDYRYNIHPKLPTLLPSAKYRQVFTEKLGFFPDPSIIDLLFNLGPSGLQEI